MQGGGLVFDIFVAPALGNNPFGGKNARTGVHTAKGGGGGGATHEVGTDGKPIHDHTAQPGGFRMHPNAHILGFRAYPNDKDAAAAAGEEGTAVSGLSAEKASATHALFAEALQRRTAEGRPLLSRWTAVDTNRAIRERVPGWTANRSVRNVLKTAGRGDDRAPLGEGKGAKESRRAKESNGGQGEGGEDPKGGKKKSKKKKLELFGHEIEVPDGGDLADQQPEKKKGIFAGLKDRLTGVTAKKQALREDARKKVCHQPSTLRPPSCTLLCSALLGSACAMYRPC
eukprot:COSAG05_NODE_98_length_19441_cov_32.923327_14_plen_285_part_00